MWPCQISFSVHVSVAHLSSHNFNIEPTKHNGTSCMPFPTSCIVPDHGPLLTSLIHCAWFYPVQPVFAVPFVGHLLTCLQPQSSYAKMLSPSKAGQTKSYSHSKLVLKQNNIAPTSIWSSTHLQSSPGMVHFLETYSDDDEEDDEENEDDEDDVIVTSGLQHYSR